MSKGNHQWTRMQQKIEMKQTSVKVRQFSLCIIILNNKTLGAHLLQTYIECNAPMHYMWYKSIENVRTKRFHIHLFDADFSPHLSLSIVVSLRMVYFWYSQMLHAVYTIRLQCLLLKTCIMMVRKKKRSTKLDLDLCWRVRVTCLNSVHFLCKYFFALHFSILYFPWNGSWEQWNSTTKFDRQSNFTGMMQFHANLLNV